MSLGRLAAIDVNAEENTLIYTVPERAGDFVATVNVCNKNDDDALIRLAIVEGVLADLTDSDYIEYDLTIRANGVLVRNEIQLLAGQSIIGYANKTNVNFAVWA